LSAKGGKFDLELRSLGECAKGGKFDLELRSLGECANIVTVRQPTDKHMNHPGK